MRERSVALKLNTLKSNVEGKRLVMVDDSIVRGTTLANIIKLLKKSGAKASARKNILSTVHLPMFLRYGYSVEKGSRLQQLHHGRIAS